MVLISTGTADGDIAIYCWLRYCWHTAGGSIDDTSIAIISTADECIFDTLILVSIADGVIDDILVLLSTVDGDIVDSSGMPTLRARGPR